MFTVLTPRRVYRFLKTGSVKTKELREYHAFLEKSKPYNRAQLNITIDFELGWSRARRGDRSTTHAEALRRSGLARKFLPIFLKLCETYDIPATFATVAHIALEDCASHFTPPIFKPSWTENDWYALDPKSSLETNKNFYGKDLISQILQSPVHHELGSHGFSHVDLADSETTPEVARFEIFESFRILKELNPSLTTFVFPKNHIAYLDILRDSGYSIYRDGTQRDIKKEEGLWSFPRGVWISPDAVSPSDIINLLSKAVDTKKIVNIWCHLYEFDRESSFIDFFESVFKAASKKRSEGKLSIDTMSGIVSSIHASK